MTHGFDDQGRQFDAQGNLKDWWTTGRRKSFNQRAQCVVDQYAQYTVVDDIKINSKLTEGEDIADLGGLILAWMAWKDQTKSMNLAPRDGLSAGAALFRGQRTVGLRKQSSREPACVRHHRSTFAGQVPRQWIDREHGRIPESLQLQSEPAYGSGKPLPDLVARPSPASGEMLCGSTSD